MRVIALKTLHNTKSLHRNRPVRRMERIAGTPQLPLISISAGITRLGGSAKDVLGLRRNQWARSVLLGRPGAAREDGQVEGDEDVFEFAERLGLAGADPGAHQLRAGAGQCLVRLVGNRGPVGVPGARTPVPLR